jgi:putative holliday junction resolvase
MIGRIMAVDPGDQRIGLAISDPTATIANPLATVKHTARMVDAAQIALIASEQGAVLIVVGQPLDSEGKVGPAARKSERLAEAIRSQTSIPVILWDESGSTQTAQSAIRLIGGRRKPRFGHLDEVAAVVILQNYLDTQTNV